MYLLGTGVVLALFKLGLGSSGLLMYVLLGVIPDLSRVAPVKEVYASPKSDAATSLALPM